MKNKIQHRCVSVMLCVALLMSVFTFSVSAAAGTTYESEVNSTTALADRTYDDYDNYGTISASYEVDFWVITFEEEGMATFWLGEIPSGCDYNMALYNLNGELIGTSERGSTYSERIQCHILPGINYYIKIYSASGYSTTAYYKMRVKNYDLGYTRAFGYNCANIDTMPAVQTVMSKLWSMGFAGQTYLNNTPGPVYNVFPTSRVIVIDNHGFPGGMTLGSNLNPPYTNTIFAQEVSGMDSSNRAISTYANSALSNVSLVVFVACKTGVTSPTYGNLVDMALSKGATCAIGWEDIIYDTESEEWLELFFEQLDYYSVEDALKEADRDFKSICEEYKDSTILERYCGSNNRLSTTFIGCN